mgnify:CR=1 FL=1
MAYDPSHYTMQEIPLAETRPTAVNLNWALARVRETLAGTAPAGRAEAAYRQAAAQDPIQIGWDANEPEFHAKTKIFKVLAEGFETEMGEAEGRDAVNRVRRRQGEEMGKKMAGSMMKLMQYMNDPEVREAQQRMGQVMMQQ